MTLLSVSKSVIEIGAVIDAVGPPDSSWKICNGDILPQSSYSKYANRVFDLHPNCWSTMEYIAQPSFELSRDRICRKGSTIIAMPINGQKVYYSTDDGVNWQETGDVLPSAGNWGSVTTNGSIFVALKYASNAGAYSSDGIAWTGFTMPATVSWMFLDWNGSIFLACGQTSNAVLYYSSNGYTWNTGTSFGTGVYPNSLCKGYDTNSNFIFYDSDYKVRKTSNGTSIVTEDLFNPIYFEDQQTNPNVFLYLNGQWWANNENGNPFFIVSSDGGDTWEKRYQVSQDSYDEYSYAYFGCFYSGEEIVFLDSGGYSTWITKDGYHFSAVVNPFYEIVDSVFISKSVGAIVLHQTDFITIPGRISRLKYTSYDYTTHFQLPNLHSNIPGMYKYIKVR